MNKEQFKQIKEIYEIFACIINDEKDDISIEISTDIVLKSFGKNSIGLLDRTDIYILYIFFANDRFEIAITEKYTEYSFEEIITFLKKGVEKMKLKSIQLYQEKLNKLKDETDRIKKILHDIQI